MRYKEGRRIRYKEMTKNRSLDEFIDEEISKEQKTNHKNFKRYNRK
tara:strand:+ start:518 stop:655 length:138 start_codon:yes stop_codon:yes gene_type:complete